MCHHHPHTHDVVHNWCRYVIIWFIITAARVLGQTIVAVCRGHARNFFIHRENGEQFYVFVYVPLLEIARLLTNFREEVCTIDGFPTQRTFTFARSEPVHDAASVKVVAMASELADDPTRVDGVEANSTLWCCHDDDHMYKGEIIIMSIDFPSCSIKIYVKVLHIQM